MHETCRCTLENQCGDCLYETAKGLLEACREASRRMDSWMAIETFDEASTAMVVTKILREAIAKA